jgi:hypothetical protein
MVNEFSMNTKNTNTIYNYENKEVECPIWSAEDFDLTPTSPSIYSQMAYKFNRDLKNGYYLEIGAGHYKDQSNTYSLEKDHGWSGVSIDISPELVESFNSNRSNKCFKADALTFNWSKFLEENKFPKSIDFLSIDIDTTSHDYANLLALLNIPMTQYDFKVIVIEHAAGMHYELEKLRDLQRDLLTILGYSLVLRGYCDDVWTKERPITENGFVQINKIFKQIL